MVKLFQRKRWHCVSRCRGGIYFVLFLFPLMGCEKETSLPSELPSVEVIPNVSSPIKTKQIALGVIKKNAVRTVKIFGGKETLLSVTRVSLTNVKRKVSLEAYDVDTDRNFILLFLRIKEDAETGGIEGAVKIETDKNTEYAVPLVGMIVD